MEKKKCKKCSRILSLTEFWCVGHKGREKKWPRNECKECGRVRKRKEKERRFGRKIRKRILLTDEEREKRKKESKRKYELARREERRRLREKFIVIVGGQCQKCGYKKCLGALDFHHKNPVMKVKSVSSLIFYKFPENKIKEEVEKCIVLCANCHRELHYKGEKLSGGSRGPSKVPPPAPFQPKGDNKKVG